MRTLAGMFELMRALGRREALRYHNGYRTRKLTYRDLLRHTGAFARFLDERGLHKGDRLILWAENRPEWAAVFWACVARGVEVVPIDFRSSPQLVGRIQREVGAKLVVSGDEVEARKLDAETFSIGEVSRLPDAATFEPVPLSEDNVVEIVFTSGTTGEPKGVVHRHRNICANLNPIHREINRFKIAARPFQPIRLLDLLPLSHLFGQSTGLMIPVLLGGAAVFTSELHAAAILETIRREKVSAVVSVPRLLQNLQQEVERKFDLSGRQPSRKGLLGAAERWWLYRDVHRRLGWKFWAFVVGGAQLEPEREDFWRRLGFVVVQGYGLTETSPVVAMNHPFSTRRGSIGKALHGQQIKLAPDGEILVRGASVVEDYVGAGASETRVEGGWLHTGDVGEIDAEGRLYFKGRKKEVIVTSEGLNVYPQDIEALLNRLPQVRDSVVVPRRERGEERVHAVLILSSPDADAASLVRSANQQLESHQRIQSWSLWPGDDFPRTSSTMKIKRKEVLRQIAAEAEGAPAADQASAPSQQSVRGILGEMTARGSGGDGSDIAPSARLAEDLGLSSLQRVELLARIENDLDVELDEERFAAIATVEDLENWVAAERHASGPQFRAADSPPSAPSAPASHAPSPDESSFHEPSPREPSLPRTAPRTEPSAAHMRSSAQSEVVPRWNRLLPVRWLRRLLLDVALLPAFRQLVRLRVRGLDNLDGVRGPVIFAANHASHFDTPAVLAALPLKWRRKVTPAMAQDYFRQYFQSANVPFRLRLKLAAQYYMACGLFNAYPLPQQMAGTRRALKYTGELIDEGWCPLVFPEGERTPTGLMQTFKGGIGLMAARLGVPIVPIYIRGMFEVYSEHDDWPRPANVVVRFGRPVDLQGDLQGDLHGHLHGEKSYSQAAARIERAVRDLAKET